MKHTGYLLIHGFGGNTGEVAYLEHRLREVGLDVQSVLLAGHGRTGRIQRGFGWRDWVESARTAALTLRGQCDGIVLLGFSMGGLIAALLAPEINPERVVFINTPVYFWNFRVILSDIFNSERERRRDARAYYRNAVTGTSPGAGIHFLRILHRGKKAFAGVKMPVLIVQCRHDESVRAKSARYIRDHMGKNAVLKLYGDRSGCHQIFNRPTPLRDLICRDIEDFLQNPR